MSSTEPLCVADYERLAEDVLEPGAFAYYAGGSGDESALRENREAFARWRLRPRMLVDVGSPSTRTSVLGSEVSMPVLIAPTALHRLAHGDGEQATARAAAAAGTVMCVSTLATATPAEVAAAAPDGKRWFQVYVYKDRAVTRDFIDQAADSGYEALVLTVDAPRIGRRERDLAAGFALPADITVPSFAAVLGHGAGISLPEIWQLIDPTLTWRDLEQVAGLTDLPLLVKGLLTDDDARLAMEHGAAGVIVSNHGGRQLDCAPASLDALPEVVEAVEGRGEVLVDGGVRRGEDVVKALALGARAVMIGRPVLWALACGGEHGVRRVLELLRAEVELALVLTGCPRPADVSRAHVATAPG
jgi:isopentenyl diphosphate isomerase/L-lactate dehydrogenase-like FMN-dependent dehydrogenase